MPGHDAFTPFNVESASHATQPTRNFQMYVHADLGRYSNPKQDFSSPFPNSSHSCSMVYAQEKQEAANAVIAVAAAP